MAGSSQTECLGLIIWRIDTEKERTVMNEFEDLNLSQHQVPSGIRSPEQTESGPCHSKQPSIPAEYRYVPQAQKKEKATLGDGTGGCYLLFDERSHGCRRCSAGTALPGAAGRGSGRCPGAKYFLYPVGCPGELRD